MLRCVAPIYVYIEPILVIPNVLLSYFIYIFHPVVRATCYRYAVFCIENLALTVGADRIVVYESYLIAVPVYFGSIMGRLMGRITSNWKLVRMSGGSLISTRLEPLSSVYVVDLTLDPLHLFGVTLLVVTLLHRCTNIDVERTFGTSLHVQGGAGVRRSQLHVLRWLLPYVTGPCTLPSDIILNADTKSILYSHSQCLRTKLSTPVPRTYGRTLLLAHIPFDLLSTFLSLSELRNLWSIVNPEVALPSVNVLRRFELIDVPVDSVLHHFVLESDVPSGIVPPSIPPHRSIEFQQIPTIGRVRRKSSQKSTTRRMNTGTYRDPSGPEVKMVEHPPPSACCSSDVVSVDEPMLPVEFPPPPLNVSDKLHIIEEFCRSISKEAIEEGTCHCCGRLVPVGSLVSYPRESKMFDVLCRAGDGVTRKERFHYDQPIEELDGCILVHDDKGINKVDCCRECLPNLLKGRIPRHSLANGNWVGDTPLCLKDLTFAEKMMISRHRHNACVINVTEGQHKLKCNAVVWSQPTQKVIKYLPPAPEEMAEVLAIYFTGSEPPGPELFKRTPLLVRRSKVCAAIQWLILNHQDYYDITYSSANLAQYKDDSPPVVVVHSPTMGQSVTETQSLDANPESDGDGWGGTEPCVFAVSGLSEVEFDSLTYDRVKALSMRHLKEGGRMLAVGHGEFPESIYNNPQLFPSMFPWLYPYGKGGFQSHTQRIRVEPSKQCAARLHYWDRRFQEDEYFMFIAFNHKQIRASSISSRLAAKRSSWQAVADRIGRADVESLDTLITKSKDMSHIGNMTDGERTWMSILKDVENIGSSVAGSRSSKRLIRGNLRSLMISRGAPLWFITFSPCDWKNPICLYYAGESIDVLHRGSSHLSYPECQKRVAANPVACAKFFHLMVNTFLDKIVGLGSTGPGLFGPVDSYFGTVEEQGRLTLHLHLLLWVKGMPPLSTIRERLVNNVDHFRDSLIAYLEDRYTGDYLGLTEDAVGETLNSSGPDWADPTRSLANSIFCSDDRIAWEEVMNTTNELVYLSHRHVNHNSRCGGKFGNCKSRFPRELISETHIDESGHLHLKKQEPLINTYSPVLTYLLRSNSDVQCLLSGTAVKAVLIYVTDYITKVAMKTHNAFECIKSVYLKHTSGCSSDREASRKLVLKMVNALISRQEVGGPLVAAYMLGNGDHYTNRAFQSFYWKVFANNVESHFVHQHQGMSHFVPDPNESVELANVDGSILSVSLHTDWVFRPLSLQDMCLYDFARIVRKKSLSNKNPRLWDSDDDDLGDIQDEVTDLPQRYLLFQRDHPQHKTHAVYVLPDTSRWVVNWVGAALPRLNTGNDDFYYMTMLMLFVPWRLPSELRPFDKTWKEAFDEAPFTESQKVLMKNMNVLYECLDARDDLSAQYRSGNRKAIPATLSSLFTDLTLSELERHIDQDGSLNDTSESLHDLIDSIVEPGRLYQYHMEQKAMFEQDLVNASWDRTHVKSDWTTLKDVSGCDRDGSEWGKQLQSLRRSLNDTSRSASGVDVAAYTGGTNETYKSFDGVVIVDKEFFDPGPSDGIQNMCHRQIHNRIIDNVMDRFSLNSAQKDAFMLVVKHVISDDANKSPLRMYLGGMGGTGKSQVIKALIMFYQNIGQHDSFQVIAPTGTAACLVGGSTYHSLLGFGRSKQSKATVVDSSLRDRFRRITTLFLDEVSMVSCEDLFEISHRLCALTGNYAAPFGGISMIFAGDFAQLPPAGPGSRALYSCLPSQARTIRDQKNALGKGLWHQVLDVVLLKENMRQRSQEDDQFRSMLENLRYKNCSNQDVQLLYSRCLPLPPVDSYDLDHVSTIVGLNHLRDTCNHRGSILFASNSNQGLSTFYSIDVVSGKPVQRALQFIIWDVPPARTDNLAGRLELCIGLPVILKENQATELCVTNGAEGIVRGWQAHYQNGLATLDVVFMELKNPPRPLRLPGLPENVVPIVPNTVEIKITLPTDDKLTIRRTQIPILPNFAMTVHSSQGRTRKLNFIDLRSCRDHKAYYTALSRASSLAGTYVVRGFNESILYGGASGYFRQEMRELEILADITNKKLRNELPESISGDTRNELLKAYRSEYGDRHLPVAIDDALQWDNTLDGYLEQSAIGINDPWSNGGASADIYSISKKRKQQSDPVDKQVTKKRRINSTGIGYGQSPLVKHCPPKRKRRIDDVGHSTKKRRGTSFTRLGESGEPVLSIVGCQWDVQNYSCAYDCCFTVLYHVLRWDPHIIRSHTELYRVYNRFLYINESDQQVLHCLRDEERRYLNGCDPHLFPYGPVYAAVYEVLFRYLDMPIPFAYRRDFCICGWETTHSISNTMISLVECQVLLRDAPVLDHLCNLQTSLVSGYTCDGCRRGDNRCRQIVFLEYPDLLVIENDITLPLLSGVDLTFQLGTNSGEQGVHTYDLVAVIYGNHHHFTARLRSKDGSIYKYDGQHNGGWAVRDLECISELDWLSLSGSKAVLCMYVRRHPGDGVSNAS
jgi:hypothetical protein